MYRAFPRPVTLLNRLVALVFLNRPVRHTITGADLERWVISSTHALVHCVACPELVSSALSGADWKISTSQDFDPNTWSLEVEFDGQQRPLVTVYTQAIWTHLPVPRWLFDILGETATDHALGHLYAFQRGVTPDETVACFLQYQVARVRHKRSGGWKYQLLSYAVQILHRFHKYIPLANYHVVRYAHL